MRIVRAQPSSGAAADPDEDALVAAARDGDHDAFAQIFRRHADTVRARLTRLVGPRAEREDLVQQVFLRLHQSLGDFRGGCALPSFIYRITVSTALDHLRSARLRVTEPLSDEALDPLIGSAAGETARAQAREELRTLFRLLQRLDANKRVAFLLVAVEGMSLAEAGEMLGVAAPTLKQRVLAARRQLQAMLIEERGRRGG
jgi:RNA polymerase sigma factor (sigma-70 family)